MLLLIFMINIIISEGNYKIGLSKKEKEILNLEKSETILFVEEQIITFKNPLEVMQNLVTWADYKKCVERKICDIPIYPPLWKKYFELNYNDYEKYLKSIMGNNIDRNLLNGLYPIETSYENAIKYCNSIGMRLPTLFEYEVMQRGGEENMIYFWGDKINNNYFVGGFTLNEKKGLVKIGTKFPNKFGLYDIAGNVFEYTYSCYTFDGKVINYENNKNCKIIIKGGSTYNKLNVFFANAVFSIIPKEKATKFGFRCVKNGR